MLYRILTYCIVKYRMISLYHPVLCHYPVFSYRVKMTYPFIAYRILRYHISHIVQYSVIMYHDVA